MERDKTVRDQPDSQPRGPTDPGPTDPGPADRAPVSPGPESADDPPESDDGPWPPAAREFAGEHPELEASRDHFAELYDFAPIAYCTLGRQGLVADINLRGADLFGRERGKIVGASLLPFVDPADRRTFLDHIYRCRTENGLVKSEIWLRPSSSEAVYAQLLSQPVGHRNPGHYRTAIIDQTEYFRAREAAAAHKAHLVELNEELEKRARQSERRAKQLQNLTLQVTNAEHSERRRIARFIHDHLQQLLVTAKLQTGMLVGADSEQIAERVLRMREVLDTAIERSRDLSHQLCPPVLDDYGLIEALEWLAEEYRTDQVMDVQVYASTAVSLANRDLQVFLFEAVREFLLNALKNGNATQTIVTVKETPDAITLGVVDNGDGAESENVPRAADTPGIGLATIGERLEMLGGTMHFETAPGRGFRVTLECPVGARSY